MNKPVDPEIDQGNYNIKDSPIPRAADSDHNNSDTSKDKAEESPALILYMEENKRKLRS